VVAEDEVRNISLFFVLQLFRDCVLSRQDVVKHYSSKSFQNVYLFHPFISTIIYWNVKLCISACMQHYLMVERYLQKVVNSLKFYAVTDSSGLYSALLVVIRKGIFLIMYDCLYSSCEHGAYIWSLYRCMG